MMILSFERLQESLGNLSLWDLNYLTSFCAIEINDENYVKLCDVGGSLAFGVGWDRRYPNSSDQYQHWL